MQNLLTASPEERARRRFAQLIAQGIEVRLEDVLAQQQIRDREDTERETGALRVAPDSIYVLTDNMTEEQVLDKLVHLVLSKRSDPKKTVNLPSLSLANLDSFNAPNAEDRHNKESIGSAPSVSP